MKKKFLLIVAICFILFNTISAQISKTVNVVVPGTLSALLTSNELNTVTSLTLTGTINLTDFSTMNSQMPNLNTLDLSMVTAQGDSISASAFASNSNLKSIILPATTTKIGVWAFYYCYNLETVDIPSTVDTINNCAFFSCFKLKSVTFPSALSYIGDAAYIGCSRLKEITLPSSLKWIGIIAFGGCDSITSVFVPSSVSYIGRHAFYSSNLTAVMVDEANQAYSSVDGVLFDKNKKTLHFYPPAKTDVNYTIPSSVITVAENALEACKNLATVYIPASVTSLGDGAFNNCAKLTDIQVDDANLNFSSLDGVLFNKDKTALIRFPESFAGTYILPQSVISLKNYSFSYCVDLVAVTLPPALNSIGKNCFHGCVGLKAIEIPQTVNKIGFAAFEDCKSLASVNIPSAVDSISTALFYGCAGLTHITIPSTVIFVSISAFGNCSSLTSLKFNAQTPANPGDYHLNIFNVDTINCTLYVPSGSLNDYRNAPEWRSFVHIVEFDFSLQLSSGSVEIGSAEGSTASFNIESNTEWSLSSNQDWLHINNLSGMDSITVLLTVDSNPESTTRQATVTVSGLGVDPSTVIVTQAVGLTDIDDFNRSEIMVYPNPVKETLYINGAPGALLKIFTIEGKEVYTRKLETNKEALNVQFLSAGMYLIKVGEKSIRINKK